MSYAEQLAAKRVEQPDRKTLYKTFKPVSSADFDQDYEPINESYPAATASSYTARGTEDLQAIAQSQKRPNRLGHHRGLPQERQMHIARDAARLLWTCRQSGTVVDALPAELRPRDAASAHAIQAELPVVAGSAVIGWKIAATSAAGQAHIQVDGPLPGRILAAFVQPIGAALSLAGNRMRVLEPEFAFRLDAALAPRAARYAVHEVLAAVGSLHPAFELPDSRFNDFARAGKDALIADDACCGQFVFGAAAPAAWRHADLAAHPVHATVFGADGRVRFTREGEGRALLGGPLTALTWLANELSSLGIGLQAGDWASCGTCMVPLAILPGDRVVADYGPFGRIEVGLVDPR